MLSQNSLITETPRPHNTTYSLLNISQENTVRIRIDDQNLWDKKGIVVNQNNRLRSYEILNKNGNVIFRNCRHLIPAYEQNYSEILLPQHYTNQQ